MNNDLQMFMFRHTGKGIDYGQLRVEGQDISYMPARGLGSVSFTTLERWHDPRSGLYIPCKWHLTMASAQGIVDLDIVGQGRTYYHYTAKKGVLIMKWILSLANGAFYFPEGRSLPIKDTLVCAEWGQAILVAEETLNGPVA